MVEDEVKYKEALSRIILFPGNIEEYKRFKEYSSVKVIDTMKEDKGFALAKDKIKGIYSPNEELGRYMVMNGIEAIVNVNDTLSQSQSATTRLIYGLPVRGINAPEVVPLSSVENDGGIKRKGEIRAL